MFLICSARIYTHSRGDPLPMDTGKPPVGQSPAVPPLTGPPLTGQVAVVTGAGRGIGAAIARKLAQLGATAVLCGRTKETLDATAAQILDAGGKTEVIPCDVTLMHQMEYASARVDSTFHRLDILVNNAGVGGFNDPLHNLPPEDWDRILNTNLRGVYYSIRAFAPLMIRAYS